MSTPCHTLSLQQLSLSSERVAARAGHLVVQRRLLQSATTSLLPRHRLSCPASPPVHTLCPYGGDRRPTATVRSGGRRSWQRHHKAYRVVSFRWGSNWTTKSTNDKVWKLGEVFLDKDKDDANGSALRSSEAGHHRCPRRPTQPRASASCLGSLPRRPLHFCTRNRELVPPFVATELFFLASIARRPRLDSLSWAHPRLGRALPRNPDDVANLLGTSSSMTATSSSNTLEGSLRHPPLTSAKEARRRGVTRGSQKAS